MATFQSLSNVSALLNRQVPTRDACQGVGRRPSPARISNIVYERMGPEEPGAVRADLDSAACAVS
jgi:hypothetical protein